MVLLSTKNGLLHAPTRYYQPCFRSFQRLVVRLDFLSGGLKHPAYNPRPQKSLKNFYCQATRGIYNRNITAGQDAPPDG